jgi:succinyl-CoA synthetase beta subunit
VIALGIIKGIMATGMKKPIVMRMKGTNIEEAQQIISDSGFNLFLT